MTQKPDDLHPDYTEMSKVWKKCRDARTGQRAIHTAGKDYLPRLTGQSDEDYAAYKQRALFYNATGRTVEGMSGLVFRKKYTCEVPKTMEPWLNDITMTGQTLEGFAMDIVEDDITVGRGGILVEYPPAREETVTVGQAQAENIRPYLVHYKAEAIRNWTKTQVGTLWKTTDIWLTADIFVDGNKVERILQLTMANGFYEQVTWTKDAKGEWSETRVTPMKNGSTIKTIPFFFYGPQEQDCELQDPPIEDLVYVNLALYMNSADYEKALHMAGNPQAWVAGADLKDGDELQVGSSTAWVFSNPETKVGYLTLEADGLNALTTAMADKKTDMAALGARMLAPEKKAAEAAETAGIRRGGENSVLASISRSVSLVIQKALAFMADWAGLDTNVTFELNKDYLPMPMDSAMLREWVAAWQSGAISQETFFEALTAGEMVSEGLTFDDEQERKAADGPPPGSEDDEDDDGQ